MRSPGPSEARTRLYLSSPDVDKLLEHLQPLLYQSGFLDVMTIVKKYGGMYDDTARIETQHFG